MSVAVQSTAALSREQVYQELKVITRDLGDSNQKKKQAARKWLNNYSRETIIDFLSSEWVALEKKRRRNVRILRNLAICYAILCFGVYVAVLWAIRDNAHPLGRTIFLVMCFGWQVPVAIGKIAFNIDWRLRHGLRALLIEYGDVDQVPMMVDALAENPSDNTRGQIEGSLALLLPEYHRRDLPPLDDEKQRLLLAEVKAFPERVKARGWKGITEEDVAYMSAILGYWQRETLAGKPLSKQAAKIIGRLARPLPKDDGSEQELQLRERWQRVQDAAKDCFVFSC